MLPDILSTIKTFNPVYKDRKFKGSHSDYYELMRLSRTIFLGNLPAKTKEEQIWALLRKNNNQFECKIKLCDMTKNSDTKELNTKPNQNKNEIKQNIPEKGNQKKPNTKSIQNKNEIEQNIPEKGNQNAMKSKPSSSHEEKNKNSSPDDSFINTSDKDKDSELSENSNCDSHFGHIKRIIMGRNRRNDLFCGFLFIEFNDRKDAIYYSNLLKGYSMDGNIITADIDYGFTEDRQFGRGFAGGSAQSDSKKQKIRQRTGQSFNREGTNIRQNNSAQEKQQGRYFEQTKRRHQNEHDDGKRRRWDHTD